MSDDYENWYQSAWGKGDLGECPSAKKTGRLAWEHQAAEIAALQDRIAKMPQRYREVCATAEEVAALREALMSIASGDVDYPEQCARRVLRELDKPVGGEV